MCYSAMYGGRSGRAKGKAPKGKKSKCSLCDAKGHTAAECPDREEMAKKVALKTPLGFGHTHKTSRKASERNSNKGGDDAHGGDAPTSGEGVTTLLASMFPQEEIDLDPFYFFDAGCDVGATLDSLATLYGSGKKGKTALTSALGANTGNSATIPVNYGGCLCRAFIKPEKPWDPKASRTTMILEADPLSYFVVGLGPGFLNDSIGRPVGQSEQGIDPADTDEETTNDTTSKHITINEEAVEALVAALEGDPERVVGFYNKLDYSPETVQLHGYDVETQLNRLRATCAAAIQADVPVQCRIAPGAPPSPSDNEADEESVAAYGLVVKDLAKVLLEMSTPPCPGEGKNKPTLRLHLSCWNGTEAHMIHLLKAFPDTLYVGMNATACFTKSKLAHECAFSVPLDRLVLETDAPLAIPPPVVLAMGRKAFCHSGCVPFVAMAVAEHKRGMVSAVEVARAASRNTIQLYGGKNSDNRLAQRAEQVKVEAAARAILLAEQMLSDEQETTPAGVDDAGAVTDEDELLAQQMLGELAAMESEQR